jgi:hypothetical protein
MAQFDPYDQTATDALKDHESFGNVSVGAHVAVITRAEEKVSGNSGAPMVVCDFKVTDPNDKDDGKSVRWQYFLPTHEKMKGAFVQLCRAANTGAFDFEDQEDLNRVLKFKHVVIDVKHEEDEYNGEQRIKARVRKVRPLNAEEEAEIKSRLASQPSLGDSFDDDQIPF